MAQKLVRNIPDEAMAAIEKKAQAADMNAEEYIRALIVKDASTPAVRTRYAIKFHDYEGPAHGIIRRFSDDLNGVGGGFNGTSTKQIQAFQQAKDLIRRNHPGDYERAFTLLSEHFDYVGEAPVL